MHKILTKRQLIYIFIIQFIMISIYGDHSSNYKELEYLPYYVVHYNKESRLPHTDFNVMLQDNGGFLYAGTWGRGLFRYDGHNWTQFNKENSGLTDDRIISMIYNGEDQIYIVHKNQGVSYFNTRTERAGTLIEIEAFRNKMLRTDVELSKALLDNQGYLWICSFARGLYRYDFKDPVPHYFDCKNWRKDQMDWEWNALRAIFIDSNEYIWLGTKTGIIRFDEKLDDTYFHFKDGIDKQYVLQIQEISDNKIMVFAERFVGLVELKYNNKTLQSGYIEESDIKPFTDKVKKYDLSDEKCFLIDREGRYLLLTKGGAVVYEPETKKSYDLSSSNQLLVNDYINAGFIDREHNIWLTTQHGITKLRISPFKNITRIDDMSIANASSADSTQHRMRSNMGGAWLYFNNEQQVIEFYGERYQKINVSPLSSLGKIRDIFINNNIRYFRAGEKYFTYDEKSERFEEIINPEIKKNHLQKSNNHFLFFAETVYTTDFFDDSTIEQGIIIEDQYTYKQERIVMDYKEKQLDNMRIKLHFFDIHKNTILIVNEEEPDNSWLFDTTKKIFIPHSFSKIIEKAIGIKITVNLIIKGPKNDFWIAGSGFGGKICRYGSNGKTTDFTGNVGLGDEGIEDIKFDSHNRLLIATETNGLIIYDFKNPKFYGEAEGLISNRLAGGIAISENGDIYLESNFAISILEETLTPSPELSIHFTGIRDIDVHHDREPLSLTRRRDDGPVILEPDWRSISISVSANSFVSEKSLLYSFLLTGHTQNWTKPCKENFFDLPSLNPGRYELKVRVTDHLLNNKDDVLYFTISRFWYETPLFYITTAVFLLILIAVFVFLLIRCRTYRLQKRAEELKHLVEERTEILHKTQAELRGKVIELDKLAKTDTLTELSNRRHILELLENEIEICRHDKQFSFSIILGDIDHFKSINDTYGHDCGDRILIAISNTIKKVIRKRDYASRWGGEEFLILLPGCNQAKGVEIAEKIRGAIESLNIFYHKQRIVVTMSFGVSECAFNPNANCDRVLKRADDNLYLAKEKGRNQVIS